MKQFLFIAITLLLFSCKSETETIEIVDKTEIELADAPIFDEENAYRLVEQQLAFGPRVPNSIGHEETRKFLADYLDALTDTLILQRADLKAFDGTILKSTNIIASFNPLATERILLAAHWDTRPFADQDDEDEQTPILGANDGASGVAVLLEVARQLSQNPFSIGVDIILFDAEDYGQPHFSKDDYMPDSYCLGSQYWAKNLHTPNYTAEFGILLDMVGAPNAIFTHEGTSVTYANEYLHKVWSIAHAIGYSSQFSYLQTPPITDDHLYVNQLAKIPMIDIIQYDKTTYSGFGWYWHTHDDNLEAIDKQTLKAVGQTLLQTVYQQNKK